MTSQSKYEKEKILDWVKTIYDDDANDIYEPYSDSNKYDLNEYSVSRDSSVTSLLRSRLEPSINIPHGTTKHRSYQMGTSKPVLTHKGGSGGLFGHKTYANHHESDSSSTITEDLLERSVYENVNMAGELNRTIQSDEETAMEILSRNPNVNTRGKSMGALPVSFILSDGLNTNHGLIAERLSGEPNRMIYKRKDAELSSSQGRKNTSVRFLDITGTSSSAYSDSYSTRSNTDSVYQLLRSTPAASSKTPSRKQVLSKCPILKYHSYAARGNNKLVGPTPGGKFFSSGRTILEQYQSGHEISNFHFPMSERKSLVTRAERNSDKNAKKPLNKKSTLLSPEFHKLKNFFSLRDEQYNTVQTSSLEPTTVLSPTSRIPLHIGTASVSPVLNQSKPSSNHLHQSTLFRDVDCYRETSLNGHEPNLDNASSSRNFQSNTSMTSVNSHLHITSNNHNFHPGPPLKSRNVHQGTLKNIEKEHKPSDKQFRDNGTQVYYNDPYNDYGKNVFEEMLNAVNEQDISNSNAIYENMRDSRVDDMKNIDEILLTLQMERSEIDKNKPSVTSMTDDQARNTKTNSENFAVESAQEVEDYAFDTKILCCEKKGGTASVSVKDEKVDTEKEGEYEIFDTDGEAKIKVLETEERRPHVRTYPIGKETRNMSPKSQITVQTPTDNSNSNDEENISGSDDTDTDGISVTSQRTSELESVKVLLRFLLDSDYKKNSTFDAKHYQSDLVSDKSVVSSQGTDQTLKDVKRLLFTEFPIKPKNNINTVPYYLISDDTNFLRDSALDDSIRPESYFDQELDQCTDIRLLKPPRSHIQPLVRGQQLIYEADMNPISHRHHNGHNWTIPLQQETTNPSLFLSGGDSLGQMERLKQMLFNLQRIDDRETSRDVIHASEFVGQVRNGGSHRRSTEDEPVDYDKTLLRAFSHLNNLKALLKERKEMTNMNAGSDSDEI